MRIPSLTTEEAMALFSHHAGCDTSRLTKEQMKAMESFVERCNFRVQGSTYQEYHPLALKVLGSRVGPAVEKWRNLRIDFKYYGNGSTHPIFSILRSSFDTLNLKYQGIFLDIALATCNCNVEMNMEGLKRQLRFLYDEEDEQFRFQVVEVLQAKSLVEFNGDDFGIIHVHDLYREFARMEVEMKGLQHSARCCFSRGSKDHHVVQQGRARVTNHHVSHITKDILSCTICVEAEVLSIEDCANLVSVDVPRMENLRLFDVVGGCPQLTRVNLEGAINLKSFHWREFEGKFYPDLTSMVSLEELRLVHGEAHSPVTLHGCLDFSKKTKLELLWLSYLPLNLLNLNHAVFLKYLYLEDCQYLETIEGLQALAQLKILWLIRCHSLEEFPSLANFPSLEVLRLEGAENLKQMQGFAKLTALYKLSLRGGRQLEELPGIEACLKLDEVWLDGTSIGNCSWISVMKDLTIINLTGTKIRFVPDCSGLDKLIELRLDDCQALESIGVKTVSFSSTFPQSLQRFSAQNCHTLNALSKFGNESALSYLNVSRTIIEDVSSVRYCNQLKMLLCANTRISSLPNLSSLTRLEVLDVHRCELLMNMDNIKSLPALQELWVYNCTSLLALPDLRSSTRLTKLNLSCCPLVDPNVVKLPSSSNLHIVMGDVSDCNQSDYNIDVQGCEGETSIVVDFQAVEPTHNLGRCTMLLNLVAMGGLLVWWLGRRQGKHKINISA